jgi:hypothetical protein
MGLALPNINDYDRSNLAIDSARLLSSGNNLS